MANDKDRVRLVKDGDRQSELNRTFETAVDLSAATRVAMIGLLNQELADTSDLYSQTKQAHWNVKGIHFYQLHLLFDQLAEKRQGEADELAEGDGLGELIVGDGVAVAVVQCGLRGFGRGQPLFWPAEADRGGSLARSGIAVASTVASAANPTNVYVSRWRRWLPPETGRRCCAIFAISLGDVTAVTGRGVNGRAALR